MISTLLNKISTIRLESEEICVAKLMDSAKDINYNHIQAAQIAKSYIENFRADTGNIGLEEFFRQYGLDTNEGIAVMSLAEALLRIPDAHTANLFIHDKLKEAAWSQSKRSASAIVKASSLGLKLASKLLELGKAASSVIDPIVRESIKQSMSLVGNHFVLGETIKDALQKGKNYENKGYMLSYDMLGEGARSEAQALRYLQNYLLGAEEVAASCDMAKSLYERPGISVKLSALYPKYKLINKEGVFDKLLPALKEIILRAKAAGITVTIDAEEVSRLDISLQLFEKLARDEEFKNFDGIGLAVQAYNKSATHTIDFICELARQTNRRIPVRLVKGAYWDFEIKAAQVAGIINFPVFTRKEYSDISYLICASKMLENSDIIYPQFATHNALTIASIEVMAGKKHNFEFQRLYGMGQGIYNQIIGRIPCRIYAPVGTHNELLPYLVRRILENSASASFLKKVIDNNVQIKELLDNPLQSSKINNNNISLPPNLYGNDRQNSKGPDLGNNIHIAELRTELMKFKSKLWNATPIINGKEHKGNTSQISAPYDTNIIVGTVTHSTENDVKKAIDITQQGSKEWSKTSVAKRSAIIEKFADLLEENRFEIMALCTREAGKTVADSIAEVREAIDFCRYYASQAKNLLTTPKTMPGPTGELNELSLHGRGIFVCISPWNFPLAIFTGQIAAALVSGNSVIAKPAEQTPLIADFAIKLLLKAGLPKNAISLLPGDGALIGKVLLNDKRVAGVAFTGSYETANIIHQSLAARSGPLIPFIAETGGINTMIIDSSAHIEQAVDDIIISAFGSSGQRCSSLRVLYVQEDIADTLCTILKGAMEILQIGIPTDFSTDIGPIIDKNSYTTLSEYIAAAKLKFKVIAGLAPSKDTRDNGYFIPPIAFEISSIHDLPGEIFGPVLHIIRFKASDFEKIIDEINACGYGLTIGLQTRITYRMKYLRDNAKIGNMYINRSMIGAVVGVQAFGGEGLSGTGPKAGGPNYLLRFTTERSFTENTASIGGNRELLI